MGTKNWKDKSRQHTLSGSSEHLNIIWRYTHTHILSIRCQCYLQNTFKIWPRQTASNSTTQICITTIFCCFPFYSQPLHDICSQHIKLILLLLNSKHSNGFPTKFTKSKIKNCFYSLQGHPLPLKYYSLRHFSFSLIQPHGLLAVLPTHQAHSCLRAFALMIPILWTTLLHGTHIDTCFIFLFKWHLTKDVSLSTSYVN